MLVKNYFNLVKNKYSKKKILLFAFIYFILIPILINILLIAISLILHFNFNTKTWIVYEFLWKIFSTSLKVKSMYAVYCVLILVYIGAFFFLIGYDKNKTLKSDEAEVVLSKNDEKLYLFNEYLTKKPNSLVNKQFIEKTKDSANFVIHYFKNKNEINWMINNTDYHALVLGSTGSGKTQRIIYPNIFYNASISEKNRPSMVISDPKGELLDTTGKFLEEQGYKVKVFNLIDFTKSECWNPLSIIWEKVHSKEFKDLTLKDYNDAFVWIDELIETLARENPDSNYAYWISMGKNVLATILKYWLLLSLDYPEFNSEKIKQEKFSKENYTLANVNQLLNTNCWKQDEKTNNGSWFTVAFQMRQVDKFWETIYAELNNIKGTPEATLGGILSNARDVVASFIKNIGILTLTSKTTLDLEELVKNNDEEQFALFIKFPDDKTSLHFLVSTLIDTVYKSILNYLNENNMDKLNRKVMFLLDEFGNFPIIPNFPSKISIARSRNIMFMLVIQGFEQLKRYGTKNDEYKAIRNNASLNYFINSNEHSSIEELSKSYGKIKLRKSTTSYNSKNEISLNINESEQELFSVADLKYKDKNMLIVSLPSFKPIVVKSKLAYQNFPEYFAKRVIYETTYPAVQLPEINWDFIMNKSIDKLKSEIQIALYVKDKSKIYDFNTNLRRISPELIDLDTKNSNGFIDYDNEIINDLTVHINKLFKEEKNE